MATGKKIIKTLKHHGPDADKLSKEPSHQGKKKRVKLPGTVHVDPATLPQIDLLESRRMTSTAKGLGLKECVEAGAHDPAPWKPGRMLVGGSLMYCTYGVCRRCGEILTLRPPREDKAAA